MWATRLLWPILLSLALFIALKQSNGSYSIGGLDDDIEIVFNDWGIPYISASTTEDAVYALGYVHAKDRLWQMDLMRRMAKGELSEFVGEMALETDVFMRTIGIKRDVEATFQTFTDEDKRYLIKYSEGVNSFVQQTRWLPLEYLISWNDWRLWHPTDSLALTKLMGLSLNIGWIGKTIRYKLNRTLGEQAAAELLPHEYERMRKGTYILDEEDIEGYVFEAPSVDHKEANPSPLTQPEEVPKLIEADIQQQDHQTLDGVSADEDVEAHDLRDGSVQALDNTEDTKADEADEDGDTEADEAVEESDTEDTEADEAVEDGDTEDNEADEAFEDGDTKDTETDVVVEDDSSEDIDQGMAVEDKENPIGFDNNEPSHIHDETEAKFNDVDDVSVGDSERDEDERLAEDVEKELHNEEPLQNSEVDAGETEAEQEETEDEAPSSAVNEEVDQAFTHSQPVSSGSDAKTDTQQQNEAVDATAVLDEISEVTDKIIEKPSWASNNWVVSGQFSKSGKPMMAYDPHLVGSIPTSWHLADVRIKNLAHISGAFLPGTFIAGGGRNDHIAW